MKRIQDKIKDLVEPQAVEQAGNFADDPERALAAYRFTDVTSDLLSRWLDALGELPRGGGAALALAGARGVGKSHTLAVFGALAGSERLRSAVADGHVAASAQRLLGRRYAVVRVRRGSRPTLAEELAAAFSDVFGGSEGQWGSDPTEMIQVAASRVTGETLVVLVDTAFDRPARVARDDGPLLGGLAVAARGAGAFLGLALDDDIAGADGANVALAGTYQISYLDPENLYRVAEQFVLRKRPQVSAALHDIYQTLRAGVPAFNWSESRFASLYPVHPLVAEVSAGVRLFVPAFAFLPFAAAAAARAVGRPALSLVLLDEVFDATEDELRKSAELREAFSCYDQLTARCVGQLPIMQRYQARLILKSLLVLSLDRRGATAGELCAALLLSDEAGADAQRQVEETLARFAEAAQPGSVQKSVEPDATRYRFNVGAVEASQATVTQRGAAVSAEANARRETAGEPVNSLPPVENLRPPAAESAAARAEGDSDINVGGGGSQVTKDGASPRAEEVAGPPAEKKDEGPAASTHPRAEELKGWARLLTGRESLASAADHSWREEVRGALAVWLDTWRALGIGWKFEALPDSALTKRVWKAEGEVRKSFGRAAAAVEAAIDGKISLEECLERVGESFRDSAETFAQRAQTLEDLNAYVEVAPRREHVRAYLATAETTGVGEVEAARRELLSIAEDPNNFLSAERRERFERLWRVFHARYAEHYAAVHDKTMGDAEAREALRLLKRGGRWREFESLARLPVVSGQVWRQAEELLRWANGARCALPVRQLLERQPSCACQFRLAQAGELEEIPLELEALMERGLSVYRRTLLMLGSHLAIALDALARRETDEEEARRARALSTAFALSRLPERFTRAEVRLVERALQRMAAPPPVKVAAPDGDAGLLTRDDLRARFEQWLDELPEQPVLIEVVSKSEINAP